MITRKVTLYIVVIDEVMWVHGLGLLMNTIVDLVKALPFVNVERCTNEHWNPQDEG